MHIVVLANLVISLVARLSKSDEDNDMVGQLNLSMYGTREAAATWQEKVNEVMTSLNFEQSLYNPCLYINKLYNIETMIHGYDFMSVGEQQSLTWFRKGLENEFELKTSVIGWQPTMER